MPTQTDDNDQPLPAALASVPVQRHLRGETADWVADQVAAEVPVALVFNGISHAVMMCTPQDLPELALGFALSEGVIDRRADCRDIEVAAVPARKSPSADGVGSMIQSSFEHQRKSGYTQVEFLDMPAIEVRLEIASGAFMRLKERRRSLAGRTGCGICGIDSLEALDLVPEHRAPPSWLAQVTPPVLFKALAAMPERQVLNQATGAVHAAGYADVNGELVAVYEDVGRHNALDKLLGARVMAQDGRHGPPWPGQGFVVMSSRASHELVRKCARLGLPLLATISAPTSLAIQAAEAAGVQLWGLVREPRAIRYTRA